MGQRILGCPSNLNHPAAKLLGGLKIKIASLYACGAPKPYKIPTKLNDKIRDAIKAARFLADEEHEDMLKAKDKMEKEIGEKIDEKYFEELISFSLAQQILYQRESAS